MELTNFPVYQSSAVDQILLYQIINKILLSWQHQSDLRRNYNNRKIWLPAEVWYEIFHFVPYNVLNENIPFICSLFNKLATSICANLWPKTILSIRICWDAQNKIHQTFANKFHQKWNIPNCPPPKSVLGIGRISIEGRINREVLNFLENCSITAIVSCELGIARLDNFMAAMLEEEISLNEFFESLPIRCSQIRLDGQFCFLCPEFFAHPFVLNCPSIQIYRPISGFDRDSLIGWLKMPSEFGPKRLKIVETYQNIIIGKQQKSSELVEEMVTKIVGNLQAEEHNFGGPFAVKLENYTSPLDEFDAETYSLRNSNGTDWELRFAGNVQMAPKNLNLNLAPMCKIEIGVLGLQLRRRGWRKIIYSRIFLRSFELFLEIKNLIETPTMLHTFH